MRGRYILRIENWGSWSDEGEFVEPWRARQLARERYPHSNWKIWDSVSRRVVSHGEVVAEQFIDERDRFDRFDRSMERLQETNAARAHLGAVARAQRERNGLPPVRAEDVLSPVREYLSPVRTHEGTFPFLWNDEEEDWDDLAVPPKVNWRADGF